MKILAVDFGDARTGLAVCDITGALATALPAVKAYTIEKAASKIAEAAAEHGAEKILLGYPINMNGTEGERAQRTAQLAELLRQSTGLEVILWDERCTTVMAHQYMNFTNTRGDKRKAAVDSLSAEIMLQEYLDSMKKSRDSSK